MIEEEFGMKPIDGAFSNSQATIQRRSGQKLPQYVATITVNIATFVYGICVAWPSSALPQLMSENNPIGGDPITAEEGSWLGGLICLGALSSLTVYSYIAERFGRKIAGYLMGIPFITGWILTYVASSATTLFVARFIIGLGSGGLLIVTPLYVGEIAEDSVRGALGSFLLLFINFGMFVSYVVGSYVSFHSFALFGLVFPVVYLLAFFWLPESPVYLVTKDKQAEALNSLKWLRGSDSQLVQEELETLTRSIRDSSSSARTSIKDLVSTRTARKGMIIGIVLCINQQFAGIFAIASYTGSIFAESGSDIEPKIATIIFGAIQLVGSLVSSSLMDRAGRKILIIISNVVMAVCLISIGVCFYLKHLKIESSAQSWLPVTSLSLYIVAFALGMGPVPFVMISEILSPQIRGLGTWVCMTILWLLAFLVAKFFPNFSEIIGIYGCFWFFAICCILGTVFDVLVLPETKNKSLEVILQELSGENKSNQRNGPTFTSNQCM